ncbi:MAG: GIY-YIG nuclease family protein [Chitinophagales bacterium]
MERGGYVYIVSNKSHSVIYIGVTSQLRSRIYEHKNHLYSNSFSHRYNLEDIVYYECFFSIEEAIAREKQIKKWRREKKDAIINEFNPQWIDLWDEIQEL